MTKVLITPRGFAKNGLEYVAEMEKVGIEVDEHEFHCRGEFKSLHKGRPNEEDLRAAAEFARKMIS